MLVPLGARSPTTRRARSPRCSRASVCAELPEIATIARPVAARGGKVYVDYLQNGRGKLIVAPLSRAAARGRAGLDAARLARSHRDASIPGASRSGRPSRALDRRGDPLREVLGPGVDAVRLLDGLARRLDAAASRRRRA